MMIKGLGQPIQKIFYISGSFILFMTHVDLIGIGPLFGYEIWLINYIQGRKRNFHFEMGILVSGYFEIYSKVTRRRKSVSKYKEISNIVRVSGITFIDIRLESQIF